MNEEVPNYEEFKEKMVELLNKYKVYVVMKEIGFMSDEVELVGFSIQEGEFKPVFVKRQND
jgi:hypothetical protein